MNCIRTLFGFRALVFIFSVVGAGTLSAAQYQNALSFGNLSFATPPQPDLGVPKQFNGFGEVSGSSAPIYQATPVASPLYSVYPSARQKDFNDVYTGAAYILKASRTGNFLAGSTPRYYFGDIITSPVTKPDGSTPADATYWRSEPLKAGETIQISATQVIYLDATGALQIGTTSTSAPTGGTVPFYYSPHARTVFATQSGQIAVTWVTRVLDGSFYGYKTEVFSVSSSTQKSTRKIYWTEGSFDSPYVRINISDKVKSVNPVYNAQFPVAVASEYKAIGVSTNSNNGVPAETRTLWFDNQAGIGLLHAYNQEGRIFVEYLGALKQGSTTECEFFGADVIEVSATPPIVNVKTELGQRLLPVDSSQAVLPLPGDSALVAAPLLNLASSLSYYGSQPVADGTTNYYAERETTNTDQVIFDWVQPQPIAIHVNPTTEPADIKISWPQVRNSYTLVWPGDIKAFAASSITGPSGSAANTGIKFDATNLPQIVYQDDPQQAEATIDATTQSLVITYNRDVRVNYTLLKFSDATSVWYVPVYSQASDLTGFKEADGSQVALTGNATVGEHIEPPAGYDAGYISSGTGYSALDYIDPLSKGVEAAKAGAIIPVNAMPGNKTLEVWWLKKISPPSGSSFASFYAASKKGVYSVSYPTTSPTILLASNQGSGALDTTTGESEGGLYIQNDPTQVGFNPNEEHALISGGRIYALRDDLNLTGNTSTSYSSEPFVLLHYTDKDDGRPQMKLFKVLHEQRTGTPTVTFEYKITAGERLYGPMPLPLLPLARDTAGNVKNKEVAAGNPEKNNGPSGFSSYTYKDRTGVDWIMRGPHDGSSATDFGMQYYYPFQAGFYIPGLASQPAEGTAIPYLRPIINPVATDATAYDRSLDCLNSTPATIHYRPVWPNAAPELKVGQTLTKAKYGMPSISGQKSVEVIYQQSLADMSDADANSHAARESVVLHDSLREKVFALGAAGGLSSLPTSLKTSTTQGKTYFQLLPPHLQSRFYYDSARGPNKDLSGAPAGALVVVGKFVDEVAGESYLNSNTLSASDIAALNNLVSSSDANFDKWQSAIAGLNTTVETFVEDPIKKGTYKVGSGVSYTVNEVPLVYNSDTAVVDYALTATGKGSGWVTLITGNSKAFGSAADPVSVNVFKVAPQLYQGKMKVMTASNPLDEKVTLLHTGDFAGLAESDYEFEWRYSFDAAPAIYTYTLDTWSNSAWMLVHNPSVDLPPVSDYGTTLVSLPETLQIKNTDYAEAGRPGIVLRANTTLDFPAASGVSPQIYLSASTSDSFTGFVVYVNGVPALSYKAPAAFVAVAAGADSSLVPSKANPLPLQFSIPSPFFHVGSGDGGNRIEIALYSDADAGAMTLVDFRLHTTSKEDQVTAAGSSWVKPLGALHNRAVVGGDSAPLSGAKLVMSDTWFTVRYRPKVGRENVASSGTPDNDWSAWTEPKLAESWIKRALAGINPFNQRFTDLYNNAVDTNVSVLTQAGTRWEGDVALNLDNLNDFGLIEIYETLLNRAKAISIDAHLDDPSVNQTLLLAAGYLSDLYTVLGNEAYADAINPTISINDSSSATEINTSRFSFEGQVSTLLDEELALLRGRDDFQTTAVNIAPVYNRLYWNYTLGINSGEAIYATNYNIREQAGASTADGSINAEDAQLMFPQAHGDAYGHYLTALTVYYKLLNSNSFTWIPQAETVTVLNQPVAVNYFHERKFAATAANLAMTAKEILNDTYRQQYTEDTAQGWLGYRDAKYNSRTGTTRRWGLDEWAARSAQGSYLNWVVGNAMLPDVDTDATHSGISKVDRTTVAELATLCTYGETFQTTVDNANSHLNPLGLSSGAIAFDISPTELKAGHSHYEQIYQRALQATLNAKGAFDQAAKMTRALRNQADTLDQLTTNFFDQENSYTRRLIDIYGTPYSSMIGVGKAYEQGYDGPDESAWYLIDAPSNLSEYIKVMPQTVMIPKGGWTSLNGKTVDDIAKLVDGGGDAGMTYIDINTEVGGMFKFANNGSGARSQLGALQLALQDVYQCKVELIGRLNSYEISLQKFDQSKDMYMEKVEAESQRFSTILGANITKSLLISVKAILTQVSATAHLAKEKTYGVFSSVADAEPQVVGTANDIFAAVRGALYASREAATAAALIPGSLADKALLATDKAFQLTDNAENLALALIDKDLAVKQIAFEFGLEYNALKGSYTDIELGYSQLQIATDRALKLLSDAETIKAERTLFRQRAASVIQRNRTNDITYRTFRNEALEQYRSLFDLASRYAYLSAKSYDYETGLLGSTTGQAKINSIVASRSLGDLTGGVPQATVSTLGDAGLAGTMAQMQADWSVAKGRLGINNPDNYGTLFSLRRELFRLLYNPPVTDGDTAWQQTLEQHTMSNVLDDPDVAANCLDLKKVDGSAVPGIVIPFSTTVDKEVNFFGLPLAAGDHAFSTSSYATKIYSVGVVLPGYVGMDPYAIGASTAPVAVVNGANALSATPYMYLIPTGSDYMRAPPLGATGQIRSWNVKDQALPLPFNLGASAFNDTQFFTSSGTLTAQPWILRQHQAFRPVDNQAYFYSNFSDEFTNSRLVGRSVWNSGWKLVIPGYTLLKDNTEGLKRFSASVKDIQLFLRTYSNAGN